MHQSQRWDPEIRACPLKASKVQVSDTIGNMFDESSNVIAKVNLKLTVFKPTPGQLLTGIVVDTSSTHIGIRAVLTPDLKTQNNSIAGHLKLPNHSKTR